MRRDHAQSFRVLRIINGCRFATLSDVSASKTQNYVAGLRQDTTTADRAHRGISAASFNYYIRDARSFFRWMVRDGRCHENPLTHLQGVNTRTDRRHDRRALSTDELRWLLEMTAAGPERYGMTGPTRAMLYQLAVETGLRGNELRSLARGSFHLEGDEPCVTIAAAYAKNRRTDTLPLKPGTAGALAFHLAGKMPTALAFNMPNRFRIIDGLKADLTAARAKWLESHKTQQERTEAEGTTFLSYVDERGRYADFHSLRHTFISNLAAGGVHPKTAQRLARHSTITLTMDRYTHLHRDDLATALNVLPDLTRTALPVEVATGTDDETTATANLLSLGLSPNRTIHRNSVESPAIKIATDEGTEQTVKPRKNAGFPNNGLYRSRTDTPLRARDFESSASANSAKRPAGVDLTE